jgi:uncharacterized OB-fold protein
MTISTDRTTSTTVPATLPFEPYYTDDSAEFWHYAARGELRMQRCSCGLLRWPASPICHDCWSLAYTWDRLGGQGRMRSWVTFRREYFPEFPVPYTVGLVELAEGPRYPALVDADADELYIDAPVRTIFVPMTGALADGTPLLAPIFALDDAAENARGEQ